MKRIWIGLVLVLVLSGAAVADRLSPASPPLSRPVRPAAGGDVWACPFVKTAEGAGALHLLNASTAKAQVLITYVTNGRAPVEQRIVLKGERTATLLVPSSVRGAAGAIVEVAGGDVTVSRSAFVQFPQGWSGGAAAACTRPGPEALVVPQGSTLNADTQIVMLNPGAADAVIDVSMLVDGQEVAPETLRRRVVPARGRLVVREGDFVFDEAAVAAVIRMSSGRVVAEALIGSAKFVDLVLAVAPIGETVALASSARGPVSFAAVAVGEQDAVLEARTLSAGRQGAFAPFAAGLPAATPRVVPAAADAGPAGTLALTATPSTGAAAIGARWQVSGGRPRLSETATSAGIAPAHRAAAVLGPPANGTTMRLLLANPDSRAARIDVAVLTESGLLRPQALQGISLGPGVTANLAIPGVTQKTTVGVVLTSTGGTFVGALEGTAFLPRAFGAYAVTAVPLLAPPVVAVEPDPRLGVPAP